MPAATLALGAWCSALAGLAYASFAVQLWRMGYARARSRHIPSAALAAVCCSALWGWATLAGLLSGSVLAAALGQLLDLARYAAWLAFMLGFLRARRCAQWLALALPCLQLAGLGLCWLQAMLHMPLPLDPQRLVRLGQLALPLLSLVLLEQVFANVRAELRWGIKPLCLGLMALFVFELYVCAQAVLFNQTDADALAIRGAVHAAVVPLLWLSVMRRKHWMGRVRLSPRAAFHTVALLGCGLYLMFLSAVGYYVRHFGDAWGPALQQGLVFVGLVGLLVLLLSATARARLRALVGKHLFRHRFDYREEWLRFTATLSERNACADPQPVRQVSQQIIRALADMLESPAAALWTRTEDGEHFRPSAHWNQAVLAQQESSHSPLCRLLAEKGCAVHLDTLRRQPADCAALPEWLCNTRAWLVVPLLQHRSLLGFCVLDYSRIPMEMDWEVLDLLKTASQQAASYLAQAQSAQALLEARKFEAFNRMSAFVAHDLKNIVTQLSLMLQNARRLQDNPAFQRDMLMTIEHALDRMRHILLQLRPAHGAPIEDAKGSVELQAVMQRIAEQCRRTRGQMLELTSQGPLHVRAHDERLERALGNMVHNALDATQSGGRAWAHLARHGRQAHICIGDTGTGMSAHFVQERLFKPFQSTKPTGMGLGAYESLQYVQELGGSIAVNSTEGQGTLVTLQLPLCEARKGADCVAPG